MTTKKPLPEGITYRNGKYEYRVQWREGDKRRTASKGGYDTIKAAQVARRKVLSNLDNGHVVNATGTLGDYLTAWLDTYTRSGTVKRSTIAATTNHIVNNIVP